MLLILVLLIISVSHLKAQEAFNESDVTFYLFTQQQSQLYFTYDNTSMQFDDNSIIVFIIHGWTESHEVVWYPELTAAYLSKTDPVYNVVQVDWKEPAGQLYPFSVKSVPVIGHYVAKYIVKLIQTTGISLDRIQITGHSLGGQMSGCIGASLQELLDSQSLTRITALDPAGPLYYNKTIRERLDETDADVVLAIHTDGGKLGYELPCGTADAYPNGGMAPQPGCPTLTSPSDTYCSHQRSVWYFVDAVRYGGMIATECDDYDSYTRGECNNRTTIDLGGNITPEDRGNFYLRTNSESPYAISQ